jgi:hypothetical protein
MDEELPTTLRQGCDTAEESRARARQRQRLGHHRKVREYDQNWRRKPAAGIRKPAASRGRR